MKVEDNLLDLNKVNDILSIPSLASDFVTIICGKHIGGGTFRDVFEYNTHNSHVIKLEPGSTDCNLVEWMIWKEVKGLTGDMAWVKDWFAPVEWISPNGRILVMKKTKPHHKKLSPPNKIPAFLWDVKLDNFGWIGNKFVCHDYGQFYNMINYPKKMRKINWDNPDIKIK